MYFIVMSSNVKIFYKIFIVVKLKDKVKSKLSLWSADVGIVSGIIPIYKLDSDIQIGEYVHVIFPETDKHEAYQQSFNSKDLIIVKEGMVK